MSKAKDAKPLTLSDTLRDLARLRVSDFDTASLLPLKEQSSHLSDNPVDRFVEESYAFAREARSALKIHNRNDVLTQGARVEDVRNKLDDPFLSPSSVSLITSPTTFSAKILFALSLDQPSSAMEKESSNPRNSVELEKSPRAERNFSNSLENQEHFFLDKKFLSSPSKYMPAYALLKG
ncbi:hypothetical protein C0991_000725 [Blastosporella zonata]|nr:hypothetical protein C0991_000725 [Blastosporella zonata]